RRRREAGAAEPRRSRRTGIRREGSEGAADRDLVQGRPGRQSLLGVRVRGEPRLPEADRSRAPPGADPRHLPAAGARLLRLDPQVAMEAPTTPSAAEARAGEFRDRFESLRAEIGKVVVGQAEVVESVMIALLAGGHVLLEGV